MSDLTDQTLPAAAHGRTMTHSEWVAEGTRRFGEDRMQWRFKCPVCAFVATAADWQAAGADEGEVAFSCIGRHKGAVSFMGPGEGPCNYAGGGLFRLNPIHVKVGDWNYNLFDFAD